MISGTRGERLRDRAARLRVLGRLDEAASSSPGTRPRTVSAIFVIPVAGHERDRRRRVELVGRRAGLREAVRERHREAGGVGGGDQLLGARLPSRLLGARGPASRRARRTRRCRPRAIVPPPSIRRARARSCSACGRSPSLRLLESVGACDRTRALRRRRRSRSRGSAPRTGSPHRPRRRLASAPSSPSGADTCASIGEATIWWPRPSTSSITIGSDVEPLGRRTGLRELARERHRQAAAVRSGEQLFGTRLALRLPDARRARGGRAP